MVTVIPMENTKKISKNIYTKGIESESKWYTTKNQLKEETKEGNNGENEGQKTRDILKTNIKMAEVSPSCQQLL